MLRPAVIVLFAALPAAGFAAGGKAKTPAPGTVFHLSAAAPKYVTADIEFRDPGGRMWPSFAYGKPEGDGTFTFDPAAPKASFAVLCGNMAQNRGDQSRRVLGETVVDEKAPAISFAVESLGPTKTVSRTVTDNKGRTKTLQEEETEATARLKIGGRAVPVKAVLTQRYSDRDETMQLSFRFAVEGRQLGLTRHAGPIEVRASVTAFARRPDAKKKG